MSYAQKTLCPEVSRVTSAPNSLALTTHRIHSAIRGVGNGGNIGDLGQASTTFP